MSPPDARSLACGESCSHSYARRTPPRRGPADLYRRSGDLGAAAFAGVPVQRQLYELIDELAVGNT